MPDAEGDDAVPPGSAPRGAGSDEFDWRGWVLVATVAVSVLVVPTAIVALPAARSFLSGLGLGLRDAYLALPMIPAVLLGAVAVWSALASRSE